MFAHASTQRHVVFLKDKNNNPYSLNNPSEFLTQRALDRRTRSGIALDIYDLPVTPSYVNQIAQTGAMVVFPTKWFNAVVIDADDPQILSAILALPFVDHIDQVLPKSPTGRGEKGVNDLSQIPPYIIKEYSTLVSPRSTGSLNYGQATNQT